MDQVWDFGSIDPSVAERSIAEYGAACAELRDPGSDRARVAQWLTLAAIGAEGVAMLVERSLAARDDATRREINARGRKLQAASIVLAQQSKGRRKP